MKTPIWKPVLIVAVIALFAMAINPRPGIDLAGGTTLVYQINYAPDDTNRSQTQASMIEVLRRRIDPTATGGIEWQAQGADRIEVRMPLAKPEVRKKRQAYIDARHKLIAGNLSASQIDVALAAGEAPPTWSDRQKAQLQALVEAKASLDAAREPYEAAIEAVDAADAAADALSGDATDEAREAAAEALLQERQKLEAATRAYLKAQRAYESAREQLLAGRIDPTALDTALKIPATPLNEKGFAVLRGNLPPGRLPESELDAFAQKVAAGEPVSHRDVELRVIELKHPDRADEIRAVAATFEAYDAVRGQMDDPEDLKAMLRGSGVLEFRIAPAPGEVPNLRALSDELMEKGPRGGTGDYRWFLVDSGFAETPADQANMVENPEAYFAGMRMIGRSYGGEPYVLLGNAPHNALTQAQKGWRITSASPSVDDNQMPAVSFNLNNTGASLFGQLTASHINKPMAIVLDGRVMSAPNINSAITGGQGIITGGLGGFSQQEQTYLVNTFNAGSLSATLSPEPISEVTTGPQFGQDNLESGLLAVIVALILVAAFMAVYYFFWGLVADFALMANLVIILGVMSIIDTAFTLPGIAGIVLTIGMAVDANVLIFERIREELERKVDLRTAARLGYDKALSAIVDGNITTLLTCLILGYTATADVKGFAVTLGIGIIATLFTALFCTRTIVNIFLDVTNVKNLGMLSTAVPALRRLLTPNIDWVGKRRLFMGASITVAVIGLAALFTRGGDMFDIEFRGGTQLTFNLADDAQPMTMAEATERMEKAAERSGIETLQRGKGATLIAQNVNADGSTRSFSIATLHTDQNAVRDAYREAFADVLSVEQPLNFNGADAPSIAEAPIYPVRTSNLGDAINRADVPQRDVSEFRGGVAILLENISPPASVADIRDRINRMQLTRYQALPFRVPEIVELEFADSQGGEARYASAVVLFADEQVNYVDDPNAFTQAGGFAENQWHIVRDAMVEDAIFGSVSNFSPQVSGTMQQKAIIALVLSMIGMLLYIWLRFGSLRYSFGAVLALVHDVVILLGILAIAGLIYANTGGLGVLLLSDFKINLAMVAAVLTLVGYSVNDTIIVFDRIRENRGRLAHATPAIINDSINQTVSRTVLTSGTTLMALFVLYWIGGEGVHGFAFAMTVGVLAGTYSSVAIAAQTLLWGRKIERTATAAPSSAPNARALTDPNA